MLPGYTVFSFLSLFLNCLTFGQLIFFIPLERVGFKKTGARIISSLREYVK